ncbi:16020_t:CDS:2, partial [Funneliformis geosporum]
MSISKMVFDLHDESASSLVKTHQGGYPLDQQTQLRTSSSSLSHRLLIIARILPCDEDEEYDLSLAIEILGGLRETIIPGTPEDYVNIYTGCWDNEPDNRPLMNQVVDKLNAIISKTNIKENNQMNNYESNNFEA